MEPVAPPQLPRGLSTRPLTLDDAPLVAELVGACELLEDGCREIQGQDLLAIWSLPGTDLASRSIGVFDGDRLVAWGTVQGEDAEVDVHPDGRRRGIGSALVPWTWAHAASQGKASVTQSLSDGRSDGIALLSSFGYRATWEGWSFRLTSGETGD